MFDVGWEELLVIGLVAMIVIGPKDLPEVIRTVGGWMRKARQMAGEFQGHVDQMLKDADLADVKKKFDEVRGFDIKDEIAKAVDPKGEVRDALSAPALDAPAIGTTSPATTPGLAAPSTAAPSTGTPSTGTPSTGTPSTGTPSTGTPSTGAPSLGTPANGAAAPVLASAAPAIAPTQPGGAYWHPELEEAPAFVPPEFVPAKPVLAAAPPPPAPAAAPVPPAFIPPPAEPDAAARP